MRKYSVCAVQNAVALGKRDLSWELLIDQIEKNVLAVPATESAVNFQHQVIANTGRTTNSLLFRLEQKAVG